MRLAAVFVVPLALILSSVTVRAACTDVAAVAATRAAAASACPCASAASHGSYVSCVAGVARAAADHGPLPRECKSAVVKCAARSTCGRPSFVTCCRIRTHGITCQTVNTAGACTAKGGTVGACASCCDACTGGCPTSTTTSTTTTSATTSTLCAPTHCGDGVYQPECGEQCDGAQGAPCAFLGCGAPDGSVACQCCIQPGGHVVGALLPLPCCNGCGNCVPFLNSCACSLQVVGGSCCAPVNEVCSYPRFAYTATCCPGLACAKPGLDDVVACCAPSGQPCSTGDDCCSNSCNAGSALCD